MWTRKELKAKAKVAFKANYWKSVLVALLLALFVGSAGSVSSNAATGGITSRANDEGIEATATIDGEALPSDADIAEEILSEAAPESEFEITVVIPFILLLVAAALAAVLALEAFIANPVEVGSRRFFTINLNQAAKVSEVAYAFDNNYRQIVRIMFARDLRLIGWGLLLIIPGIVKSYEYRMIPYLLAEDPTLTKEEAFAQSKRLMDGNKWRAFVLDLSFIGWELLGALTLGIVGALYVGPYKAQTDAELYEALRYGDGMPSFEALSEA